MTDLIQSERGPAMKPCVFVHTNCQQMVGARWSRAIRCSATRAMPTDSTCRRADVDMATADAEPEPFVPLDASLPPAEQEIAPDLLLRPTAAFSPA